MVFFKARSVRKKLVWLRRMQKYPDKYFSFLVAKDTLRNNYTEIEKK